MDDLDRLYRRLVHNIRASHPEYLTISFTVQELYESLVPYRHNRRELAIETNQDYEATIARLLSGEQNYVQADPAVTEAIKRELASPTGDPGIFKEYAHAELSLVQSNNLAAADEKQPRPTVAVESPKTSSIDESQRSTNSEVVNSPDTNSASGIPAAATMPSSTASSPARSTSSQANSTVAGIPAADSTVAPITASTVEQNQIPVPPPARTQQPTAETPKPIPSLLASLTHIAVPTGCRFCSGTLPDDREVSYCPHCGENLKTKRCPACSGEMDSSWRFCVTCGRRSA